MAQDPIRQQELEEKRRCWSNHIQCWQTSRLSQTEYCRRHGLKFHQFVYWRRKFAPKPTAAISLVRVPPAAIAGATGYGPYPAPLRVALAPDLVVEVGPGFDPPTLQQLVNALRELR
jgi:hypothetical protein